jgi:hypothetical protein
MLKKTYRFENELVHYINSRLLKKQVIFTYPTNQKEQNGWVRYNGAQKLVEAKRKSRFAGLLQKRERCQKKAPVFSDGGL